MGGWGSGRPARNATVEGCASLKLDVNAVVRAFAELDRPARVTWGWRRGGEPWAKVAIEMALGRGSGQARLLFDVNHASRRTGPQDQRVEIVATPCRFGGVRWWWICPTTGRRCVMLYLPNGGVRFLSRAAYRLTYQSQKRTPLDRTHGRLAQMHRRLGGHYAGPDAAAPRKPKWMRWRTYDAACEGIEGERERLDVLFMKDAERFSGCLPPRT